MQNKQTITRREMLLKTGKAVSLMGLLTTFEHNAFGQDTVPKPRIISHTTGWYFGWPTVGIRKNGELLVVSSGMREEHVCPFGAVDLIRSHDGGETWTWHQTLYDGPIDDRDSGICVTSRGTILVTTFTSLAYEPILKRAEAADAAGHPIWPKERLLKWQGVHNRISAEQRQNELGCWMIRSTDGGVTWSQRYSSIVNSPHGPSQLSDGRLLYAGKKLWEDSAVGVCQSTDDGQTWQWLASIPERDGDREEEYHELHQVEAANGDIIVQIRNHNKVNDQENLQTESSDGGKTWSKPHTIGVWGIPSFLMRLKDDRLMMTYGHRRVPLGVQARLSTNNGGTWSEPIVLYGDGVSGDLGYPSTVQQADGSLLTVWYEAIQGKCVLQMLKWPLPS